ncbi:MAG: hypothetical protein V1776_00105 [Candidatus Diapherotrites archaeon]
MYCIFSKKGQASMPDLLFSVLFFLLLLAGFFYYSDSLQDASTSLADRRVLDATASNLAEFIIKNPGAPSNWEHMGNLNSVEQIGLAQKDRVLSPEKVVAFVNYGNLEYEQTKIALSLPYYDFYVEFSGGISLSTGLAPGVNKNASVVQRLVTINGVETQVTLTLYES